LNQSVAVFFFLIHYGTFANNGVGVPFLSGLAEVLEMFARLAFILLLILLAKGMPLLYAVAYQLQATNVCQSH
jgi:hypothetical protein